MQQGGCRGGGDLPAEGGRAGLNIASAAADALGMNVAKGLV